MRPIRKRALGVIVGLALGWLAQGWAQDLLAPVHAQSPAVASLDDAPTTQADDPAHNHAGAEHLAPGPHGQTWAAGLALGIAGLFALALLIGIPASRFVGAPADDEPDHPPDASTLHRHTHTH